MYRWSIESMSSLFYCNCIRMVVFYADYDLFAD